MKHFNKIVIYSLLSFSLIGLVSCNNSNVSTNVSSINNKLEIKGENYVGLKEYATLTCYKGDVVENVKWESLNKDIASVSSTGMVKGLKIGKATIKAISKNDENLTATFDINVRESMQIGLVLNRFYNASYKVESKGDIKSDDNVFKVEFNEMHYLDSYDYQSSSKFLLPSYGLASDKVGTYLYNVSNSKITSATYLRSNYSSYNDVIVDLTDLKNSGVNFSSISTNSENVYNITNKSILSVFYYIWAQNIDVNVTEYTDLKNFLTNELIDLNVNILTPYSFTVEFNFSNYVNNAIMSFELINSNKSNTKLENFLSSNSINYPEVDETITKLNELVQNHNYYRSFGTFSSQDGTKIDMGKAIYTEDAIYFDFNEEYIDASNQDLFDYGYVNIHGKTGYEDGVYYFTNKRNKDGNQEFKLGSIVNDRDYLGNRYLHYYDFYENLTLVVNALKNKEYTFTSTKTADYDTSYKEFLSDCDVALNLTQTIFKDEIDAFSATASGLLFAIKIDDDISKCVVNYGAYLAVQGSYGYIYSSYAYSGFGSVTNSIIENFLNNL